MNIFKFYTSVPFRICHEFILGRNFDSLARLTGFYCKISQDSTAKGTGKTKSNGSDPFKPDEIRPRANVQSSEEAIESIRLQRIKRVMKTRLQNMENEGEAMKEKEAEFEIGRRHLANMMGADSNTFTQKDIDRAIEYLMPSGLFSPRARPQMKPPTELFPPVKGIEFDETGRPLNMFFFTGRGNFYTILHEISGKLHELNKFEDQVIAKGISEPPHETKIFLEDSEWMSLEKVSELTLDKKLPEADYNYLIESLKRLVAHPYSFRVKDFIIKYRTPKLGSDIIASFPPLTVGEDGIAYATAIGSRKWTRAQVTVKSKGTGEITINGTDISFFPLKQDREQILFPLKFSGLLNQVDIEATLTGQGGHSAEAGAIRHGISVALGSFVSPEVASRMRIAGLIEWNRRTRERKKPGQEGARAKFTW